MRGEGSSRALTGLLAATLVLLAACASKPPAPATYTVKRGDTLYAIAWRHRLDYRELARWNRIGGDYVIYPGQVLRLAPPGNQLARVGPRTTPPPRSASRSAPPPRSASRPAAPPRQASAPATSQVASRPPATNNPPAVQTSNTRSAAQTSNTRSAARTSASNKTSAARSSSAASARPSAAGAAPIRWQWPVQGGAATLTTRPNGGHGLTITGRRGQEIRSAADGKVVYTGSGLLGYGQLLIIKHSDSYLSAYGHTHTIGVREGDSVRAGQPVATMGNGPQGTPMLYFEIRINGVPHNPLRLLPPQ